MLLRERTRPGPRKLPLGVYWKWTGIRWALAHLADLGYPAGNPSPWPRIDRALKVWLGPDALLAPGRAGILGRCRVPDPPAETARGSEVVLTAVLRDRRVGEPGPDLAADLDLGAL